MSSSVVTKCGGSNTWTVLTKGLRQWLTQGTSMETERIKSLISQEHTLSLQRAVTSQESMGWKYAFRGYLSIEWIGAYRLEHPTSPCPSIEE
jgi:hypothetical protein